MAVCDGLFVYYNEARRLTQGGLRYQLKRGRRWWCCARVHQPDGSGAWTARSLGNAKASDRGEARGDRLPADGNKTVSEELLGGGANFLAADFFGMQRIDRNKQQDRTYLNRSKWYQYCSRDVIPTKI
eukprot:scaffold2839_cov276-Alexandrium_tamarense.AAC.1